MAHTYHCLTCKRDSETPLEIKTCGICGDVFCVGCLPDHEALCAKQHAAEFADFCTD